MKLSGCSAIFWGVVSVPIVIGVLINEYKDEWKEDFDKWNYNRKMQAVESEPYSGGEELAFYCYPTNEYKIDRYMTEEVKAHAAEDAEDVGVIVRYTTSRKNDSAWELIDRESGESLGVCETPGEVNSMDREEMEEMCDWVMDVYDEWLDER